MRSALADILIILGAGVLAYAAWQFDPIAGLSVCGLMLIAGGVVVGSGK